MTSTTPPPRAGAARPRRQRPLGEDATASLEINAAYQRSRAASVAGPRPLHYFRATFGVLAALYLFVLALRLLSAAAGGVAELLTRLSVDGALNLLGFGWLLSYGALSGSPVAALALSLLDGGALSTTEALGMIAGSRFGASLIVLLVGFVAYAGGRRNPDGIYVGVVALLTTATIYAPATALAAALLRNGIFDRAEDRVPAGWGNLTDAISAPLVEPLDERLPAAVLFLLGVSALLAAFWLFDRLLPNLDPPSPRIERLSHRFASPRAMFLFGALLTAVTMSVAISVTILIPLTLKGVVRRTAIVPYIMGANITTFVDTLFAATLVATPLAAPVVLAQVSAVTAISAAVLLVGYGSYSRLVLAAARVIVAGRRWLVALLAAMAGLPLLLLAL